MVYRDTRDPRVEPLKQLLAREPELLARRAQIRRAHDALQERVDVLGREVAEAERGGIVATVVGWFRKPPSHRWLAKITAELTARVVEERAVDAELAQVAAARAELVVLEAQRLLALRTTPGPLGDELRALDDDLALEATLIAALREILIAGERAETLLGLYLEVKSGLLDNPDLDQVPPHVDVIRAELAAALATLDAIRERHALWPLDPQIDLPRTELATIVATPRGRFEIHARRAAGLLGRLQSKLAAELRERQQHHAALAERQHELVEQAS